MAIGQSSPDRSEQELHRGKRGNDNTDDNALSAEMLAVNRHQGHDNPEADEVDENGQENDEDGRLSHARRAARCESDLDRNRRSITRVYGRSGMSQAGQVGEVSG